MTASTATREEARDRMVRFVEGIASACRKDAGTRATLRRTLGRPLGPAEIHPTVERLLPRELRPDQEQAYYTVAALIAFAPQTRQDKDEAAETSTAEAPEPANGNLGITMAHAVVRPGKSVMSRDTAEKRLQLLTRQGPANIHRQVTGVVRHLAVARVPVDWAQLLDDLRDWRYRRDRVAKAWLQSYYRTLDDLDRKTVTTTEDPE